MTRYKAIKILEYQHDNGNMEEEVRQALAMAIEALSAEASEGDLISRRDVIKAVGGWTWETYNDGVIKKTVGDDLASRIYAIPSAHAPQRQSGEWVMLDGFDWIAREWKCSNCGRVLVKERGTTPISVGYFFCPNCGADMRG